MIYAYMHGFLLLIFGWVLQFLNIRTMELIYQYSSGICFWNYREWYEVDRNQTAPNHWQNANRVQNSLEALNLFWRSDAIDLGQHWLR